jgi:hypothetical protein
MASNDELDRGIDDALAEYSGAEPLAGLEERVLHRVRVAARRRLFGWAAAIAVAAALVVTVSVVRVPHHADPPTYRVGVPAVMRPAPEKSRVVTARRAKPRALRARRLPKLEQFPAPTPPTAEERALIAFVEHHPAEAEQVFAALQKRSDEPIEIQPIQIPPLRSDGAE